MRPPSVCFFFIFWNFRGSFFSLILVFENFEIVFWIRIPIFGGVCFIKIFDLRPPYVCFWFFLTLGGLFEFDFWFLKISKLYFESEFPLLGVCFIKLFDLRPPYICFWFFGTLGGLFLVWFLVFENFEIVFWIRITTFGGVCFIKLFYLRPPYKCFWFYGTLGGLLWVWFWKLDYESEF